MQNKINYKGLDLTQPLEDLKFNGKSLLAIQNDKIYNLNFEYKLFNVYEKKPLDLFNRVTEKQLEKLDKVAICDYKFDGKDEYNIMSG
jgi:hypothetical protein